jgi:hypothetical protein
MFLQHCFDLLDGRWVPLPEDLIGDGRREHVTGMFQADAGRGNTASVISTRDTIRDTVASYAISGEQGARKKVLDNRQ